MESIAGEDLSRRERNNRSLRMPINAAGEPDWNSSTSTFEREGND